jgi:hypothetical protein
MNIKTIKQIDVDEWDNLVEQTYGKIYSFQQQDDCQPRGIVNITVPSNYVEDFENTEIPFEVNGSEMGVSFETWLNTTPEETRKHFKDDFENRLFWDRNFYPSIDMIINDLHSKGLLEEGKYQINIDW